jgi:ribosomal protein L37AE/L43A
MAIYGVNFNGTEIPDGYRKRFRPRMPLFECRECGRVTVNIGSKTVFACATCGVQSGDRDAVWLRYRPAGENGMARLVGVATDWDDSRRMCIQADNGSRQVWRVRRTTAGADCFGIYVY